ncbi:UPF0182 family protein [Sphaerisporangium sp. TRM90804]|uniref:UPF0182 family membrane protein n=1 Tax=Sphaerisporangium sp. TRM90804 TaxID=3031113 RepID=UPI0024478E2C|nr:UPF0182 family protein [Sphaerisporangium sp. TRM90804]MDH2429791.1 UPF0182 family protein [Sphaerisporangium sp. TRM90804]
MRMPRRPRLLVPVAIALVVLVIFFFVFAGIFTDWLWFDSVGYTSVFSTMLSTQLLLFVFGALIMGGIVGGNMVIAYRTRPLFGIGMFNGPQGADRYRAAVDPHRKTIFIVGLAVLGLFTGSSVAGQWSTWLLYVNRTPFGSVDPLHGIDKSFFMFTYPFIRMVLGFLFTAVIISIVVSAIVHYLYGGFRLQSPGLHATRAARVHLSVLIGLFILFKAVAYWVDRYGLVFSTRGKVFGASYTDVNAVMPAKNILAIIALICALLFFAGVVRPGGMLPGVGFGLMVLSAVLVGAVYPALVEQFQVKPNQQSKERDYIARNITATRDAYNVASAEVIPYSAKTQGTQQELQSEVSTIPGVRLLDPTVLSPTFQQLQQIKGYYQFPEQLDVDRYTIDGESRDTVVAVREIGEPPDRNWINDHLVYTHGFGFVAGPGSRTDSQGKPDFIVKDIPPTNGLGTFEPRIYFGENSPQYSIVGGDKKIELDFPEQSNNGQGSGQENFTYTGKGGVPIGNFFTRLLYAAKYGETNLLLSSDVNSKSRILYNRDPRDRIQQIAPFLTLDSDPYPAIVNGRILWIVDGYTMSEDYPYSQRRGFGDMTRDTSTDRLLTPQQPRDHINYIRNSVKATVDAYDGTVQLYTWDEKDPLLRTWEKAFGDVIKPKSAIPPQLMEHLRFPEDLFKVQRDILGEYHVTDADAFYGGQDFWKVPEDPASSKTKQPPYYVTLRMPNEREPRFSLTSTMVPNNRDNLAAFMAVDATGDATTKIQILQLPSDTTIPGPKQAQNTFDTKAASVLNDLRIGGTTETLNGNLLTLPFGGGLLYVEPVYVQPKVQNSARYPTLARVLVMFGSDVGIGTTLQDALEQVFGQGGQAPTTPTTPTSPTTPDQPNTTPLTTDLTKAYENAQKAYDEGQEAIKKGDFAAYGEAQKRLSQALKDIESALNKQKGGTAPSPSATPTPVPSAASGGATPAPSPSPSTPPSQAAGS